ncbi:MAG: hypothetical protein COA73_11450 [Candidatus Hydrogenedentota bacterium]|nr:MAG: hypothetical protein COA73_11450 [Candidatus Hydrogenedentota bacterium]
MLELVVKLETPFGSGRSLGRVTPPQRDRDTGVPPVILLTCMGETPMPRVVKDSRGGLVWRLFQQPRMPMPLNA